MRKSIYFFIFFIVVASLVLFVQIGKPKEYIDDKKLMENKSSILPTEQFIVRHLLHEDGTIRTNLDKQEGDNLALSESLGLWMEYLVMKKDNDRFHEAYETLLDTFLLKEGLVAWRVEDGVVADTNALIDDIRIIKALGEVGERTGCEDYIETAKKMAKSTLKYNRQDTQFVDFYDVVHRYANEELTLSYIDIEAFDYMYRHELLSQELWEDIYVFLKSVPLKNGFFPKSYHTVNSTFKYEQTVNLIDQVYTAIHIERSGAHTDDFNDWLKDEFYKEHLLYGRYDLDTKKRAVDYESASVYALTIIYSLERNDKTFAEDVYSQMLTMQEQDEDSPFYGGYVTSNSTHSFDNLFPLLAERILMDAEIIQ